MSASHFMVSILLTKVFSVSYSTIRRREKPYNWMQVVWLLSLKIQYLELVPYTSITKKKEEKKRKKNVDCSCVWTHIQILKFILRGHTGLYMARISHCIQYTRFIFLRRACSPSEYRQCTEESVWRGTYSPPLLPCKLLLVVPWFIPVFAPAGRTTHQGDYNPTNSSTLLH